MNTVKRKRIGVEKDLSWPVLGCGVGLRHDHYQYITETWPSMDWFEAVTENYMDSGGKPIRILEEIRHRYPVALHGVSLSIGSVDPLNKNYLKRLKALVDRIDPAIVSDHLCWTRVDGNELHDLLPLPFTEEAIQHVVRRVEQVQEFLGRRILLENVSTYVTYRHSEMCEWEFLTEIAERSDCGILLDLNNIYVNSVNHRFDPYEYVNHIPGARVGQFHLAGHADMGTYLFDTHDHEVIEEVWNLYRHALKLWGPITTLIEWDANIPDFPKLAEEASKARAIYQNFLQAPQQKVELKISPPLAEVQRWFKTKMKPDIQNGAKSTEEPAAALLNLQNGVPGLERIAVYAEGYKARIEEALSEAYEAVRHVLGHERFHPLAEKYAERYASKHYNLSSAGKHFPVFLRSQPLSKEFPFLPDLASLEWRIHEAFHAYDEPPLEPGQLASLSLEDWSTAQIFFQPSVGLLASEWPVLDIWNARKMPVEKIHIDLINQPQQILITRQDVQVRCELLSKPQFFLIQKLLQGKSLGNACEELGSFIGESEELPIQDWFSRWVQEKLMIGIQNNSRSLSSR